jgi:hypothetical protein
MPEGTSQVSRSTAIALAVGGLVVGAIAGGVIVDTLFGGNEAPIRVKNTSIDLRLLGPDHRWQRLGTDRYSVQGPPKGRSDYYIEIEGTNCTVSEYGATVALEHSNGTILTVAEEGNHTRVTPSGNVALTISPDQKTLTYSAGNGFLRVVRVNGTEKCRFNAAADLSFMELVDN